MFVHALHASCNHSLNIEVEAFGGIHRTAE